MRRIIGLLAGPVRFILTTFTSAIIKEEIENVYHPSTPENNRSLVEAVLAWMRSFIREE